MRTDHAALKFSRNIADRKSCLMCWSLRLSEFDFEIEHVPGSKVKYLDAPGRHAGLVEDTQLMSKELMLREQKKDSFCNEQIQKRLL